MKESMPHLQPSISQKEHDPNKAAKRVVMIDPFGGVVSNGNFTTKVDEPDASTTYVGNAQIGTATSSAGWQIQKVSVSGAVTTIAWAGGTDAFTQIWDNRAALSYS